MKRLTLIAAAAATVMIIVSGCGSKTSTTNAAAGSSGTDKTQGTAENAGTRQMKRPDLVGEVSSIIGNEATIKVIEMPQGNRSLQQGEGQAQNNQRAQGQFQGPQGGGPPAEGQSGQSQKRTLNYTGETKTFNIPVGIPITTITRGQNGIETKELNFDDIKKGAIMQLWYSEKDKEIITRINVSTFTRN